MVKSFYILCSLLFFSNILFAQIPQAYNVQAYSTENGLPSNGIKGMQWDEQTGFLWLATEAGIVRFNGATFKNFTKENTPIIATERMLFMIRNWRGKIYAADQGNNILSIYKNTLSLENTLYLNAAANKGSLSYLVVSDSFFYFFKNHPDVYKFSVSYDYIAALNDTSLLAVHEGRAFYKSLHQMIPLFIPEKDAVLKSNFKIGADCFIVTNNKTIYKFNPKDFAFSRIPLQYAETKKPYVLGEKHRIHHNYTQNNSILIDGADAYELSFNNNILECKLICSVVPKDVLIEYAQYSAIKKILFLGTNSKGIISIKANTVVPLKKSNFNNNERNAYYSQIELPNGNVLTNEGHVLGNNSNSNVTLPINGKFNFSISYTKDSILWFSQIAAGTTNNCLHQKNLKTGELKVFPKIRANAFVVLSLNNGETFISSEKGFAYLNGDTLRPIQNFIHNGVGNYVYDALEVSPNNILLATCNGLLQWNIQSSKLDTVFTAPNYCVRTLWQFNNYIFFGTYGKGFYALHNKVVKKMPLDKNNYLAYAHCFMNDGFGNCWISTNRGLFKTSIADLMNYLDNKTTSIYYHYFGRKDGMDITEMNGGCKPCAIRLKNQILSFPTMDGLLQVDPVLAKPILPDGELFIDGVFIDGKKWSKDSLQNYKIPFRAEEIVIQLGFSAWSNLENIYLEYQLNDTLKWKPITSADANIRFNNLDYGTYKLRIRKWNGFGINNYTYTELHFTIQTPWYKQWWFYLLSILLILALLYVILEFRTRQLKKRENNLLLKVDEKTKELQQQNEILEKNNAIKSRLISIISHDIVTPLKFLTVTGKKLLEKRSVMPDAMQEETLKEIADTSQELQLLSTNILNWIKYQNENRRLSKESLHLHILVHQVFGVLQSIAKQKGLELQNKVVVECKIYQYFEPLKILIYNLVSNAINFSEKGSIAVSAVIETNNIIIIVEDQGVGLSGEQIKNIMADQFIISSANVDNRKGNGLGYLIIKDLLKMMDANLRIESEKNIGTRVFITIPNAFETQNIPT